MPLELPGLVWPSTSGRSCLRDQVSDGRRTIMISWAATRRRRSFSNRVWGNDRAQRLGQHRAHHVLLRRGKHVTIRSMVLAAELVCRVPNRGWPFSASRQGHRMVSRSRISPTSTTSGSSRNADRKSSVEAEGVTV